MDLNFRLILIIISVVAICGIYINGRYKIRKGIKNPYKLKADSTAPQDTSAQEERFYDADGFDQDGIRRIKTVVDETTEPPTMPTNMQVPPAASLDESVQQTTSLQDLEQFEQANTPVADELDFHDEPAFSAHCDEQIKMDISKTDVPVYSAAPERERMAEPVKVKEHKYSAVTEQEKPANKANVTSIKTAPKKSKAELKRDQMALDFDDKPASKVEIEQEVLALSVVCPNNMAISGAALLPQLITLGLKFGEMNIFHRHKDNAGNGPINFSLANMVNPGTFDIDNMEHFTTQGLTLFMTLPNSGEPGKVFQLMLSAAKQLAKEFGGQVLDSKRSVMTIQTEQHYISKIREFDRRSRLAQF